jgi:hypothetical protein
MSLGVPNLVAELLPHEEMTQRTGKDSTPATTSHLTAVAAYIFQGLAKSRQAHSCASSTAPLPSVLRRL